MSSIDDKPVVDEEAIQRWLADRQEELDTPIGNAAAPGQKVQIVVQPADIHLTARPGAFKAEEDGSWGYTAVGVFAVGRWEGEDEDVERVLLVPYSAIAYLDIDFSKALASTEVEETPNESDAGEDSSD